MIRLGEGHCWGCRAVTHLSCLLSILIVMVFCGVIVAQLFSTHKVMERSHIDTFRRITFVCGSCRRL